MLVLALVHEIIVPIGMIKGREIEVAELGTVASLLDRAVDFSFFTVSLFKCDIS